MLADVLVRTHVVYVDRVDAQNAGGPFRESARVRHVFECAAGRLLIGRHGANRRERPTGAVHGSPNHLAHLLALHSGALGGEVDVLVPSDIGWLAGQSHPVYGPLVAGGTGVLCEGMLDSPSHARACEIVERYRVGLWPLPPRSPAPSGLVGRPAGRTRPQLASTPDHCGGGHGRPHRGVVGSDRAEPGIAGS